MAVDLTVVVSSPNEYQMTQHLRFDDDGYYWFLYPLFEQLHARTGQMIDLYGEAQFNQGQLLELYAIFSNARGLIAKQPEIWLVHTGTQTHPVHEEIYSQVDKTAFSTMLTQAENMIQYAIQHNGTIMCRGD